MRDRFPHQPICEWIYRSTSKNDFCHRDWPVNPILLAGLAFQFLLQIMNHGKAARPLAPYRLVKGLPGEESKNAREDSTHPTKRYNNPNNHRSMLWNSARFPSVWRSRTSKLPESSMRSSVSKPSAAMQHRTG